MTVDARGYSCPMPVVMVQKAVKADAPATLEVLVDNQCSVENVTRFAENSFTNVLPIRYASSSLTSSG